MSNRIDLQNAPQKEHWALGLMLLLGLIHGLIYVSIVPPWQHYDEPGHFEHAWLIANRATMPHITDFDQGMRREVAASMIEHGFFERMDMRPNLLSITEPIWIGISQLSDPHAYYWLVALPLRLLQTTDITFQLYVARMVSLLFYLFTLVLGYAIACELTPRAHILRWVIPLTMVMIPGFTDIMTALNNDVGATLFFSAFLWLSVRTIRKGAHWLRFLGIISLASLCFFTKSTVAFAPLFTPIPIILSLLGRGQQRRIAWGIIACGILAFLLYAIVPGEPAFWYDTQPSGNAGRIQTNTPQGEYAFRLRPGEDDNISELSQPIVIETSTIPAGTTITLGGWAWANQPADISSPRLVSNHQSYGVTLSVDTQPQFFSFTIPIEAYSGSARVILPSSLSPDQTPITVYFDGLILVQNDTAVDGEPIFDNPDGLHGTWAGKSFNNYIRNGSAETPWFGVRRTIGTRFSQFYPGSLFTIATSLGDWQGAKWYFERTFDNLFRTFWAKFGWGHVSLVGGKPYRPLIIITIIGVVAALIAAWAYRNQLPRSEITFLLFAGSLVWGAAFFRGIDSLIGEIFIPSARYACPAIIPTAAFLCLGWYAIGKLILLKTKIPAFLLSVIYLASFVALDILSIWSIVRFYTV